MTHLQYTVHRMLITNGRKRLKRNI